MKKSKKQSKKQDAKKKTIKVQLKLRAAKRDDFILFDKYVKESNQTVKKFKPNYGTPYWLLGKEGITNWPYILDEHTDMDGFKDYLNRKQIFIAKKYGKK